MDDATVKELDKLLTTLKASDASGSFLDPVNWKKLRLHDYRQVVKRPMDLKTITKDLHSNKYNSPLELWSDVDLIWLNCQLYNQEDSEVYQESLEMEKLSWSLRAAWEADSADAIVAARDAARPNHTRTAKTDAADAKRRALLCKRIGRMTPRETALFIRCLWPRGCLPPRSPADELNQTLHVDDLTEEELKFAHGAAKQILIQSKRVEGP